MTKEEWERKRRYYEGEVKKIAIPEWPTEAQVKNLSSKIDTLYTEAIFDYGRAKVADDNTDRLIERQQRLNASGSNDAERKRSGMVAVTEYRKRDGEVVDLLNVQETTNERLVFMDNVLKALESKLKSLTLSYGTLKMESNLHR